MLERTLSADLEALDAAAVTLERMTADGISDVAAFDALMALEKDCASSAHALTLYYAEARSLSVETEERLWQAVCGHHRALVHAYQWCFEHYHEDPARCGYAHALPALLAGLAENMQLVTLWRHLRYQPAAPGYWLDLHHIYRDAERHGCVETVTTRPNGSLSVGTVYLQALMLDTLNLANMVKREIVMVASWLQDWGGLVHIERAYLPERHLFYVDLEEDRGARRIRNIEPRPHYRYWTTDDVMDRLARVATEVAQGALPVNLALLPGEPLDGLQRLIAHLQAEWSRHDYRRQRRAQARQDAVKRAQVVNGILNVCQHVKNVAFSSRANVAGDDLALDDQEKWVIENESRDGFGAVVDADFNLWLQPGKLIALDYTFNRNITVVGVVRSLQKLPENKCHVGVEVLSHTPAYVRMRLLTGQDTPRDLLTTAAFPAPLDTLAVSPFSALYLPRDEERNIPPSLLLPLLDFVEHGHYELRWDHHNYRVRLSRIMEQGDDWVRVEVLFESKLN